MPADEPDDGGGERPERHLASHVFNIVVFAVGVVGLWWMIHSIGWEPVEDAITSVGWWFALILALDIVALGCDAAALQAFMRPEARMVSYWRVLGAQASGRAINVLTPGGALGEPTKLSLLVSHAPKDRVLSSLVLLNLGQLYLSVIVMIIGTPIMFLLVDIPHEVKVLVAIGFAAVLPLMVALALLVKRGALTTLVGMIHRIRVISDERADTWKLRVREVDKHIRELQRHPSHGTWKGFLWVGASKLVTWGSTLVLLRTADVHVSAALIVGFLSVGVLIQWVAQIVPMGVGVLDGGNYALFDLVGASGAHGVGITLLNRARSIIVAILGLGAMAVLHLTSRLRLARMRRKLEHMRERAAAAAEAPAR